jgi:hypothetical protein
MPLNLYRRHQSGCEARFPVESKTGEFQERTRGWKRCGCFILATGTLSGKFKRRYTGKTNWDEAKAVVAKWEKAGSWDGEAAVPEPLPQPAQPHRVTIDRAVKAFLAELHETLAFATHKKYRLLLKRFVEFSEKRGYVMMDQWEPSDVREFRTSWGVSPQTAGRNMSMVKPFFEYSVANKWLTSNPARMVKNPRGRDAADKRGEQKLPFTDDELTGMYAATKKYGNTTRHTVTTWPTSYRYRSIPGCVFQTWRCSTSTACARTGKSSSARRRPGRMFAHGFPNGFRSASLPEQSSTGR